MKGEAKARKEDFDEALRQIGANTRRIEEVKAGVARTASLDAELRNAAREFTTAVGAIVHSMCWVTWDAVNRRRLDPQLVKQYDEEAHSLLPKILGQLAIIAMLDAKTYRNLNAIADSVFYMDVVVADAIVKVEADRERGWQYIEGAHARAVELEQQFRGDLMELLRRNAATV